MSSIQKKILGFLIGVFFLWLAVDKVDFSKIPAILSEINPKWLLLVLVSITFEHLSRAVRWKIILNAHKIRFFNLYCGVVLGYLFNNLFPARAGEFVRAFYIDRQGKVKASEVFGSIILERFLDGVVVISLAFISFMFFPLGEKFRIAAFSAAAFYVCILFFIVCLQIRPTWIDAILKAILRPFPETWAQKIQTIKESFVAGFSLVKKPGPLAWAVIFSYVSWGVSLTTIWLSFGIFNINLDFHGAILLSVVLSLGAMLPGTPGMMGIFEYLCVLALSDILKVPRELAATYALFLHATSFMYVLIVGYSLIIMENLSLADLKKAEAP